MEWFKPYEFDRTSLGEPDWLPLMSQEVLTRLDSLRSLLNAPIMISPVRGALGRYLGASFSDHNVEKWGEVRAADIFPTIDQTSDSAKQFLELCKEAGFSAIGCYPHWRNGHGNQQVGFHVGWRPERTPQDPALWGMVKPTHRSSQQMVSIWEAFENVGLRPGEKP